MQGPHFREALHHAAWNKGSHMPEYLMWLEGCQNRYKISKYRWNKTLKVTFFCRRYLGIFQCSCLLSSKFGCSLLSSKTNNFNNYVSDFADFGCKLTKYKQNRISTCRNKKHLKFIILTEMTSIGKKHPWIRQNPAALLVIFDKILITHRKCFGVKEMLVQLLMPWILRDLLTPPCIV